MDKQDILNCEKMLELFNEMYFKELKGSELFQKMLVFKNFATTVNKFKNPPKIEPVKPVESIKPVKPKAKGKK